MLDIQRREASVKITSHISSSFIDFQLALRVCAAVIHCIFIVVYLFVSFFV